MELFDQKTVVGICPNCTKETIFSPTKREDVYTCKLCHKVARQWMNGKIHWAVITDDHPYVDYI